MSSKHYYFFGTPYMERIIEENDEAKFILVVSEKYENSLIIWNEKNIPDVRYGDDIQLGNDPFDRFREYSAAFNTAVLGQQDKEFIRHTVIYRPKYAGWRFIISDFPIEKLVSQIRDILSFVRRDKITVHLFK